METAFTSVIERIFSNWTALKLAVDHMGGSNGHQVARDIVNYMTQYCTSSDRVAVEDIQDALEDIMDDEFDTICEDESPKEIASALYMFLQLLRDNNSVEFQNQYNRLPELKQWLITPQPSQILQQNFDDSSSDDEEAAGPVPDTEWTEVKSRRRR